MADTTIFLISCLERLKNGDMAARDELVARVYRRLRILTDRMLISFPRIARWEQPEDLLQQAAIRIYRSLEDVVPATPKDFFRLATLQLRRELIDMARHYFGPEGPGANRAETFTVVNDGSSPRRPCYEPFDTSSDPAKLAIWTEFHAATEQLPEMELRTFELLWYHELSQPEAAELLQISQRQLRRYWQSARLKLQAQIGNQNPKW